MSNIIDKLKKEEEVKTVIIQARIPKSLKTRLDKCLKANKIKVSGVIRELIEDWLSQLNF